jgi:hypothetical protein
LADVSVESTFGTAPRAGFWLALEQEGPWGRLAVTESRLDPALGRVLDDRVQALGGRFALIRRAGGEAGRVGGRRDDGMVFLGYAGAAPWLLAGTVGAPTDLLDVDLSAAAAGDLDAVLAGTHWLAPTGPVLLVCTNGRRDACCAVRGRPVARAASAVYPGRVWATSHTGGHRFAPTGVLLPWGRGLGRLDPDLARTALAAADRGLLPARALGPRHDRGLSSLSPAAMAAESAVREALGEARAEALSVSGSAGYPERFIVSHVDGRSWVVTTEPRQLDSRPESCGGPPVPRREWVVRGLPAPR